MEDITISIIVPIYNAEKYIGRCVNSLINQTLHNIEILLVDDGSTDNSKSIIDEFAKNDNRIRKFYKQNGGVSSARNVGIMASRGTYISFVDADDWCEKDMFEKMHNSTLEVKLDFVNIGYSMDNKKGKTIIKNKANKYLVSKDLKVIAEVLSTLPLGYSVMKLFKRNIIIQNKIKFKTNLSLGEDAIFVQEYIKHINSIAVIDSSSYHYVRCNNSSLSTKYISNISEFIETFWNKEDEIAKKFPGYKKLNEEKGFTKKINGTIFYIINNYKKGCPLNTKQRRDYIKRKMENKEIYAEIKNFRPSKFSDKVFVYLFKLRSPLIMDLVYSMRGIAIKISSILTGMEK